MWQVLSTVHIGSYNILNTNKRKRGEMYIEVGYAVAQLVEALRYKPEGHGFDSL
jgi:hypothetical protein